MDRVCDEVYDMPHDEVQQYLGQYRSLEGWQEWDEEAQYMKAIELKYEEYMYE
jgi:hypothetical protein